MREKEEDIGWIEVRRKSKPFPNNPFLSTSRDLERFNLRVNRHGDHRGIASFFFTCFPDNFGEEEMWNVFRNWGKVLDVYIPTKKSRQGSRFWLCMVCQCPKHKGIRGSIRCYSNGKHEAESKCTREMWCQVLALLEQGSQGS